MNSGLFRIIVFLTLSVVLAGGSLHAQSYECSQPAQERDAIIREAEKDGYTTRAKATKSATSFSEQA